MQMVAHGFSTAALFMIAGSLQERLHTRDMRQMSGLWQQMPRYRWLARIVALPGIRQAATLVYDHILAPLLYRSHLRRQRRATQTLRP